MSARIGSRAAIMAAVVMCVSATVSQAAMVDTDISVLQPQNTQQTGGIIGTSSVSLTEQAVVLLNVGSMLVSETAVQGIRTQGIRAQGITDNAALTLETALQSVMDEVMGTEANIPASLTDDIIEQLQMPLWGNTSYELGMNTAPDNTTSLASVVPMQLIVVGR